MCVIYTEVGSLRFMKSLITHLILKLLFKRLQIRAVCITLI